MSRLSLQNRAQAGAKSASRSFLEGKIVFKCREVFFEWVEVCRHEAPTNCEVVQAHNLFCDVDGSAMHRLYRSCNRYDTM